MFFGYKRLKLIALMCIVISFKTTFSFSENYSMSLGLLAKHMKGKGIDIIPLFSHPEFMIYEDVDEYFKKSAESKGIDPYIKAIKKGDMKEAERVLKREYEKYKDTIGFYNKKAYACYID